jgi:hypothetical protein
MITTSYGNWTTRVTPYNMTLESQVADALDSYEPTDEQLAAVCAAYRAAITDALPPQVVLAGNEFYGPAHDEDCQFDGYPTDENGRLDFSAIVDTVDFWKVADPILNDHAPVPESAFGDEVADNCAQCGLAVTSDGTRHGTDE